MQDNPMLTIEFPSSMSSRVLNALRADPLSVDLRALSSHFYSLAIRCFDLFDDDEVVGVMLDVGDYAISPVNTYPFLDL